jgi:CRP/FNR family cyclic AMP-dependent transcriptional regulator
MSNLHPVPLALEEPLLRELAASGGTKHYPAHAVLVNEGDRADTLFIVVKGRVKVYAANESGREVVLNTLGPGEYFGELALDGEPRSASVMTLEPTTCVLVTGATLRDVVATHPDFALHLIRRLIGRVRALTGSVKGLALEDVYTRVVQLLAQLAQPEGPHRVVQERLTQQDIADRVGSSREMVSRIFKELVAGGYVQVTAGRITMLKTPPAAW